MKSFQNAIEKLEFEKVRQRVLRYASSDVGAEAIRQLPCATSLHDVRRELSLVSEMKRLLEDESGIPLDGVFPVRDALQRSAVEGTVLLPKELAQVHSTLRAARTLRQFLLKRERGYPDLWSIAHDLHVDKVLEFNLDRAIDEAGYVKANASRELQSLRRSIAEKYEQTRKKLESILKTVSELGFSQDEIITTRDGRMVIPVKAEHKNRVHGFIHSASASGATVFIEPSDTLDLNNEIRSLQFQEQREVERILRELTMQVGEIHEKLLLNLRILGYLDSIHARAKYSIETLSVQPTVTDSGSITLKSARHPLLLQTHGHDGTIPLDVELGGDYNTIVISGPNAGGKSVAMKTVGLLTLMAQSGMHIPAGEGSVLRLFDKIFVDIGDDQSIENDLSTFSSHLQNLKRIYDEADDRSLVLIDEIGSGTDPAEGGALAAALLESLTQRGTHTIATTHHSALKVFAHNTPRVVNGAMEFDQATLSPTYKFKAGIPGSSYALDIAKRLGFQDVMLERSREFMGVQQAKLEQLIADLELSAQQHRAGLESLRAEKARLASMIQTYEQKLALQTEELKELRRKAVEDAERIIDDANRALERSIREIREHSADREVVRQAREDIAHVRRELAGYKPSVDPSPDKPEERFTVGDRVMMIDGSEVGEIAGIAPDEKSALVLFGNVKMKVLTASLRRATTGIKRMSLTPNLPMRIEEFGRKDLDLRGMTGEEAIPLVDKFIDSALLAGLHRVDIIHGKGTGALRKKVADFLAKHPHVKSFRLGEWNEGGTGATVVELSEN